MQSDAAYWELEAEALGPTKRRVCNCSKGNPNNTWLIWF